MPYRELKKRKPSNPGACSKSGWEPWDFDDEAVPGRRDHISWGENRIEEMEFLANPAQASRVEKKGRTSKLVRNRYPCPIGHSREGNPSVIVKGKTDGLSREQVSWENMTCLENIA